MRQRGFTLIELLVVVAIIGMLATIVLGSVKETRARGDDGRRLSDLRQIQNALELYYADHRRFPDGFAYTGGSSDCGTNWCALETTLADYMTKLPRDPNGSTQTAFRYYYDSDSGDNNQSYGLMVRLEAPSNYPLAANDGGFSAYGTNGAYYEIGPQIEYCAASGGNWWTTGSTVCSTGN